MAGVSCSLAFSRPDMRLRVDILFIAVAVSRKAVGLIENFTETAFSPDMVLFLCIKKVGTPVISPCPEAPLLRANHVVG